MQQAMTFPAGGNALTTGKTAKNLHRVLMGGTLTLQNTGVGGNGGGGVTGIAAAPPEATTAG